MADYFNKIIENEKGIVVEKILTVAKEASVYNGVSKPASPERYYLVCLSGSKFLNEIGFISSTTLKYEVDNNFYNAVKYNSPVLCDYTLTNNGSRAVSVKPIKA